MSNTEVLCPRCNRLLSEGEVEDGFILCLNCYSDLNDAIDLDNEKENNNE
jgi:hypothetical protein